MGPVNIVTEGTADLMLLRRILPEEVVQRVNFIPGHGSYSAQSLARSILASRQQPVALVIDSDTDDKSVANEREAQLREALHNASPQIPYKVLVVHPAVEILLFESRTFLESLAHRNFSEAEWELAKSSPKKFLTSYISDFRELEQVINKLDDYTIEQIRNNHYVVELTNFLELMNNMRGFSVSIRRSDTTPDSYIVELVPKELQQPLIDGKPQRVPPYPKAVVEFGNGLTVNWLILPERFAGKEKDFEAMVKLVVEDYLLG